MSEAKNLVDELVILNNHIANFNPHEDLSVAIDDLLVSQVGVTSPGEKVMMVVVLNNGRYHRLPYVDHSVGLISLSDTTATVPFQRLIALRHIVEVYVDDSSHAPAVVYGSIDELVRQEA